MQLQVILLIDRLPNTTVISRYKTGKKIEAIQIASM